MNLRSPQTEQKYQDDLKNSRTVGLWEEPSIYETKDFKIINNKYPYDLICSKHLLLLSKISKEEAFYHACKYATENDYDYVLWNTPKQQSVPSVIHIHILKKLE